MTRVLLFGGTVEGRELACALSDAGVETVVSVATEAGAAVLPRDELLDVRVGRLDEKAIEPLMAEGFDWVVDATHPYAVEASDNVRHAALTQGLAYLRIVRPASDLDGCIIADSVADAVSKIRRPGNVLATTGSKEIAAYTAVPGFSTRLFVRVLDDEVSIAACLDAGVPDGHILVGQGPFSVERNLDDIDAHDIETLVTKDGGAAGGFPEKVEAARLRGIDLIVIRRPGDEEGVSVTDALRIILGL